MPPVTCSVPLVLVVLSTFCVNVTALFAVSVVNAPELALLAPIAMSSIAPTIPGLIVTVPAPVGCILIAAAAPFIFTVDVALNVPLTVASPVNTLFCPTFKFWLMPTPPVTATVPVALSTLAMFPENVTWSLALSVVKLPAALLTAPITVPSIFPPSISTLVRLAILTVAVPSKNKLFQLLLALPKSLIPS